MYGEPGVGKSRLANEFLSSLEGTTILTGRCFPYGESITYWPLAEIVKCAADIADDDPLDVAIAKLRDCCPAEAVADLLGLRPVCSKRSTASAASRRSPGRPASGRSSWPRPSRWVLVFEDIHWAEEPLLELIEHMTAWVATARR